MLFAIICLIVGAGFIIFLIREIDRLQERLDTTDSHLDYRIRMIEVELGLTKTPSQEAMERKTDNKNLNQK